MMKRISMLIFLFITACNPTEEVSTKTLVDVEGDAAFPYIDVKQISVTIDSSNIVVDLDILNIPSVLTYDSVNSLLGPEYSYRISFDLDGDNSDAGNLFIKLESDKEVGDVEKQGPLLSFTTYRVLYCYLTNSFQFQCDVIANSSVAINGNRLTFTIPRGSHHALAGLTMNTPLNLQTFYKIGGTLYVDSFPDDLSYIK